VDINPLVVIVSSFHLLLFSLAAMLPVLFLKIWTWEECFKLFAKYGIHLQ